MTASHTFLFSQEHEVVDYIFEQETRLRLNMIDVCLVF